MTREVDDHSDLCTQGVARPTHRYKGPTIGVSTTLRFLVRFKYSNFLLVS